jgi:glycosyltransferase involved in cell wall biosynthesis
MTCSTLEHGVKGGLERHAEDLCQGLVARGHRITAITTQHPEGRTEIVTHGVRTMFLPHVSDRAYAAAWWQESALAFSHLHRADPVDVIWSQGIGAYGYLRRRADDGRIPCVTILHGAPFGEWRAMRRQWGRSARTLPKLARFAVRTLLFHQKFLFTSRNSDLVICVSPQLAEDVVREFGIRPGSISVIPNGVDTVRFAPDETARQALRARLNIAQSDFALLTAGRLERAKGHHLAFQVAARLLQDAYPIQVMVAGSGPDEAWLHRQSERLGLAGRVRWLGYMPHEEMPAVYNASDVTLMLSLHTEAFPYAVVEAMACARMVVASRVGGVPAAIADETNGVLVAPGDDHAVADKLERMFHDAELRAGFGRRARQTVLARFALDKMICETEAIFLRHTQRREEATQ